MTPAHERFAQWLKDTGLTRAAAGKLLDCSDVFVGMIERGDRTPGLMTAHAIERETVSWTEGQIRTEEWLSLPADEHEPTVPGRGRVEECAS